jgi:uncharacterized repeat protein (TIGR01451 family)
MNPLNSLKPQRSLPTHPQPLTWAWLGAIATGMSLLGPIPAAFAAGEIQIVTTFDPIILDQGGEGKLKYIIQNNEATPLTNATLIKVLPAGFDLDVAKLATLPAAANTCGLTLGTSTARSLRITGGTLPRLTSPPVVPGVCNLELPIIGKKTANPNVTFNIAVGEFTAGGFGNSELSPGSITIRQLGNLSPTMTFGPTTLPSKGRTQFTLGLNNGTGKVLTGAKFTNGFTIPAGFILIPGSTTNTCTGATLDPAGLAATPPVIKLLSGTIPAAGCSFSFEFEGPTVTTEQTFGPISWAAEDLITDLEVSNNTGTSNSGTIEGGIKIQQSFNLNPVYINESSTMTIRIRNANATAVTGETLESFLSNNGGTANFRRLQLGGTGGDVTSTCPTTPAVAYDNTTGKLSLTNLSVPASVLTPAAATAVGECTITLQLVGTHDSANAVPAFTSIGSYTSTIATGQLTAQGLGASNQLAVANAGLTIEDLGGNGPGIGVGVGIRTQYSSNGTDFGTARVAASNRGVMRIWLDNNAGEALNGVAIGGTGLVLPGNLRIADAGAIGGNCTALGNITAPVGGNRVTMTGGTIARRNSCYIDINVISDNFNLTPGYDATAAAGVITTAAVTGQNGRSYTNAAKILGAPGSNYLEVNDFLTVYPSFATPIVAPNADARMRLSLRNAQSVAKAGAKLRYRLPYAISGTPDYEASAGCGLTPADFTIVGAAPNQDLVINALNIPASTGSKAPAVPVEYGDNKDGECLLSFDVQAPATPAPTYTVAVAPGTLTDITGNQQNRRQEFASFGVQALTLELNQRFTSFAAPDTAITALVGAEPAYLEVRFTNPTSNPLPLTNITLNDPLEQAEALAYPGARSTTTCVGAGAVPATVTVAADGRSFRITGADLAVGASCITRIPVTTLSVALLANDILVDAAISAEGAKSNSDGDSIRTSPNIALVKDFETPTTAPDGTATIATDGIARLNLTVLNATTRAYNDLSVVDNLPDGLKIASTPNVVSTCGAVSAPAEGTTIRLNGGSIPANRPCKISINVTSLLPNAVGYENIIPVGGLKAGVFENSKPATARLLVTGTTVQRPGLRLVKRATALNIPANAITGTAAAAIDLTTISVDDTGSFDNAPGWPLPLDLTSGISTYLKGATDTAQLALPGKQALTSGTEVEYSGYYLSNGTVGTTNVKLCDFIPANTTYKAGSLVWVNGAGVSTPVTDATGFLPATTTAFPAVCSGPNNSKGAVIVSPGTLTNTGTGSYGYFKFKVTID